MDLYAYAQKDDLEELAKQNGIDIPRCRGYRLMSEEELMTEEEIATVKADFISSVCEDAVTGYPIFSLHPWWYSGGPIYERKKKKYLLGTKDEHGLPVYRPNWKKIHGKYRKNLKFLLKKGLRNFEADTAMWHKYAGRDDVLYIHAKLGSWNWSGQCWEVFRNEPWFLDAADDVFDPAYCNIFAKITK